MTIEVMGAAHILTITLMPALLFICLNYWLRNHSEKVQTKALMIICIINALLYIAYKIAKATDPATDFDIFYNLPLHFCNINLVLLPLAIKTKNKYLLAY